MLALWICASCAAVPRDAGAWCQGAPRPQKSWWCLFETGVVTRVTDNGEPDKSSGFVDVGYMRNFDNNHALGLTLIGTTDDPEPGLWVTPRSRRWLSAKSSLELSLGTHLTGDGGEPGSFLLSARLNFNDKVSLLTQWQTWPVWDYRPDTPEVWVKERQNSMRLGLSVGGYHALGAIGLILVVAATDDG